MAGKQIIRNVIKRHKCQPCADQKKKIVATAWCTECQVGLCSNCHKHHDSLKLTRYHHVISMRAFQAKITTGQLTQKMEKMQIKEHQQKQVLNFFLYIKSAGFYYSNSKCLPTIKNDKPNDISACLNY